MITKEMISRFRELKTPFYFYDLDVLHDTLKLVSTESSRTGFRVHYAIKANPNPRLLRIIASYGIGADCVSGNEIACALNAGIDPSLIVFAGVGKTDNDIRFALKSNIYCFNCESIPEIEVINQIAGEENKTASIALRINPDVEAHTHKYITTGIEENKFGINPWELEEVLSTLEKMKNVHLMGIHFHIGSQITKMPVFLNLSTKVNELQEWFASRNVTLKMINVGGGLGIDYENPSAMPDFTEYFNLISKYVELRPGQELHSEPGRSIIGQCGSLISKVLYVKKGRKTRFAIIDAGMNDLIRPALYQAQHKIENISSDGPAENYDVVGPICESADVFGKFIELPHTERGDIIAIRSAGAYGESMASRYNMRDLPGTVFSDELQ